MTIEINKCEFDELRRLYDWARETTGCEGTTSQIKQLESRILPDCLGLAWPRYEDDEPVSIGDRYVNISGDVRTVEYVTVEVGASALCSHDLDDDVYEPGEHVRRPASADTWGQLREDAMMDPREYCEDRGVDADDADGDWRWRDAMNRDLIDRAERLAKGGE